MVVSLMWSVLLWFKYHDGIKLVAGGPFESLETSRQREWHGEYPVNRVRTDRTEQGEIV